MDTGFYALIKMNTGKKRQTDEKTDSNRESKLVVAKGEVGGEMVK